MFDDALGLCLEMYKSADAKGLIHDWKSSFRRADVVVFPNYELPVMCVPITSSPWISHIKNSPTSVMLLALSVRFTITLSATHSFHDVEASSSKVCGASQSLQVI